MHSSCDVQLSNFVFLDRLNTMMTRSRLRGSTRSLRWHSENFAVRFQAQSFAPTSSWHRFLFCSCYFSFRQESQKFQTQRNNLPALYIYRSPTTLSQLFTFPKFFSAPTKHQHLVFFQAQCTEQFCRTTYLWLTHIHLRLNDTLYIAVVRPADYNLKNATLKVFCIRLTVHVKPLANLKQNHA